MKAKIISIFILLMTCGHIYATQRDTINWECKTLNTRQVTNFTSLCNCYGYVRYFYPNPNLEKLDWVKFLMYAVNKVDGVRTDEELKVALNELFLPLCPSITFSDDTLKSISKIKPPYYAIKHNGIGNYAKIFHGKNYTPITFFSEELNYDSLYCYKINDKLFIRIPIAVHHLPTKTKSFDRLTKLIDKVDEGGINTLNFIFNRKKAITTKKLLFHKFDYRIADLMIRYNFIQHFYGFYDEDGLAKIAERHFITTLNIIAQTDNLRKYYYNLCSYTSIVKDQHLIVWPSINVGLSWLAMYLPMSYPDIVYEFVKDTCYIKNVGENYKSQITKGDIIVSVNNQPVQSLVRQKLLMNAYSTEEAGLRRISRNGKLLETDNRDSIIKIALKNQSNQSYEVDLKTNLSEPPLEKGKYFLKKFDDGSYYINLCSDTCTYTRFKKHIPDLQSAKAIIFDLRGYPQSDIMPIISQFIDRKIEIGNLVTPIYRFPNHINIDYETVEKLAIEPAISPNSKSASKKYEYKTPLPIKIEVPVVFLINAETISFGESIV